jgi:RimJ/RimL family protein N-acetyltransferase
MQIQPVELTGQRVKLIPMRHEHASALYEAGRDPQIWSYMPMFVRTEQDMERLVREALADRDKGNSFPFVICDLQSGSIVGSTRFLDISSANRHLEIGWTWHSPEVWRTRVNTECKYLLLRHCFETLGTVRVQIKTDSRNLRSQHAIERLGAVKEGVLRKHRILPDGYIRDTVMYSIVEAEWPAVKKRLEAFLQT